MSLWSQNPRSGTRGQGGGVWGKLFSPWALISSFLFLVALFFVPACGRKTPVRPPELVAPEPITDLTLEVQSKGVRLQWGRPQKHVDGRELEDLGGFVILRAAREGQKENSFVELATVAVDDRDRFRKAKKFSYIDNQLTANTLYRYRVQAFTVDGYYSSASNTVELFWQGGP